MFNPDKRHIPTYNEIAEKNAEVVLGAERKKRIQETDFIDNKEKGYTEEEIKRDMDNVRRMQEKFKAEKDGLTAGEKKRKEENEKRGEALEVIIVDKGGELEWFGPETKLARTSKHDDIHNGVDGVAEFVSRKKTTHRVALAVDASMNADHDALKRKIERNILKITNEKKRLEVKYFKSAVDNFKGKLNSVIPVVVGLEGRKANELIALFSEIIKLQSNKNRTEGEAKKLEQLLTEAKNHPCQIIYLKEIEIQISYYKELFAGDKAIKAQLFVKEIDMLLGIIESILEAKKEIPEGELVNDGVYRAIKEIINLKRQEKRRIKEGII